MDELTLHGAFRALGLSSSPRPDGSGITFVCPRCKPASRLVLDDGVACPKCSWSAKGEPWEIAKAASEAKTGEKKEDAEKPSLGARLQEAMFLPTRRRKKAVPVLGVGQTPVCFAGDLTVIEAQAKSGKSAFVAAAISSVFALGEADCLGWLSKNPDGKSVLHFDTEQSADDHDSMCERIWQRSGVEDYPGWLQSFCLTGFTLPELRQAVELLCEMSQNAFGGVHSIFIDGIADFIADVNSVSDAEGIVAWCMMLAAKYQCPVILVIHLNPIANNGQVEKARGHLGTALYRKAAHVLRLRCNDDGVTTVSSYRSRKAPIPRGEEPQFRWCNLFRRHVSAEKAVDNAEELKALAGRCFDGKTALKWDEVAKAVQDHTGTSRDESRKRAGEMRDAGFIVSHGKFQWKLAS